MELYKSNGFKKYEYYGCEMWINMWNRNYIVEFSSEEIPELYYVLRKYTKHNKNEELLPLLFYEMNKYEILIEGYESELKTYFRKQKISKLFKK